MSLLASMVLLSTGPSIAPMIVPSQSTDTQISVSTKTPTVKVNPGMYGIFFEEINQAGEGGVYAELIQARGMEDGDAKRLPTGWSGDVSGDGNSVTVDPTDTPDPARPASLKIVQAASGKARAINSGFWGVPVEKGKTYRIVLWAKSKAPIRLALETASGAEIGPMKMKGTGVWQRYEITWGSPVTDPKARFVISLAEAGTAHVAFASMMPKETWKGRKNGLRKDLAGLIEGFKPGFVRFPGGCFIEGHDLPQAFDWKKTLGPVETRKPHTRSFWGYPASNGLGFHEYLQWCEDLGAKALFVSNCGMSHTQVAPMSEMKRYVQDTLDAIEYANGPITSTWGAMRAANGHPEPFNLKYIQIGNENGGPAYDERYALIGKAIKERYPEIEIIANVWGGVPKSYKLEIIDEHYYSNPTFFWRNANRYDKYDRSGPKIYVGEYAVTRGSGTGNLAAALSEAAFMTGMERNADVVHMASYAPLFVNVNNRQWNPNAIVFDNHRVYGTPSFWVQSLFANHRPDRVLSHSVVSPKAEVQPLSGTFGIQTWRTAAEFKDVQMEADGKVVFQSNELKSDRLDLRRGAWSLTDGVLKQTSEEEDRRAIVERFAIPKANKVTLSLKAKKLKGYEGFIIMMALGQDRELQWNLGGWGNTVHAFQVDGERTGKGVEGRIETDRWYDIKLVREGKTLSAYLDGKLIEQIEDVAVPNFAAVAGIDEKKNEIILKVVNGSSSERAVRLNLDGMKATTKATGFVLGGGGLFEENSFEQPSKFAPRKFDLPRLSPSAVVKFAPHSFTVLRIPRK